MSERIMVTFPPECKQTWEVGYRLQEVLGEAGLPTNTSVTLDWTMHPDLSTEVVDEAFKSLPYYRPSSVTVLVSSDEAEQIVRAAVRSGSGYYGRADCLNLAGVAAVTMASNAAHEIASSGERNRPVTAGDIHDLQQTVATLSDVLVEALAQVATVNGKAFSELEDQLRRVRGRVGKLEPKGWRAR